MKRIAVLSALFVCLGSLAARPNPVFASPYTLTANGVWHSNDGLLNGTWEAHFDVAGFDLSGTLNLIGMPGIAEGNLSGTWDLDDIGFGIMFVDQELLTFDGALDGLEFVGSFESGNISGVWTGLLTSLRLTTEPIIPVFDGSIPTLLLGQNSGNAGDILSLVAKLYTAGEAINRIDNILSFDPSTTPILSRSNGKPNCSANPVVDPGGVLFEFLPQGCSGSACNQVRAVLDSLNDLGPFLDGVSLFTCKVGINSGATSGIYNIVVSALQAFDTDNLLVELNTVFGQISVKAKEAAGKLGCDCSIMETSPQMPLASLLAPLAIVLIRRLRRGSRRRNDDLQA
jgi:hypothetical protein